MKKIFAEWKWTILGLLSVFGLAFGMRIYNLTLLPVFADEAIYIRWSQIMKAEPTLRFLPLSDGKQPLFMWLVIPFLKFFEDPLFAGRFASAASGMAGLLGVFLLTYYLFKSKKAAIVAALIYALSPFALFFDRMALVDSLLSTFGVWVLLLGVITAKSRRLDFAMLTGFSLGGALLTKSPAIFFSMMLPATWLLASWPNGLKKQVVCLIKLAFLFIPTYLIAYGMYNILRLGPNFHLVGMRNYDYVFPLSHLWTNPRDPFIFLIDRSFEWIRMLGPIGLLFLGILGTFVNIKKRWKETLVLGVWFLFPILVQSEFAKVFTARYILFSLPPLIILAASSFATKSKPAKWFAFLLMVVFIVHASYFNRFLLTNPQNAPLPRSERSGYLEEWTAGTGIREIADFIKNEAADNPETKIVVGTEGYFGTLPDGLLIFLNDTDQVTVIGVGLSFLEIPPPLVESRKSGNKTYLVVNSSRFNGDPESLRLVSTFPKARRPEGTKEYIIYGPQDSLNFFEVTPESIESSD